MLNTLFLSQVFSVFPLKQLIAGCQLGFIETKYFLRSCYEPTVVSLHSIVNGPSTKSTSAKVIRF